MVFRLQALLASAVVPLGTALAAQQEMPRRTAAVGRVEPAKAPRIDGHLTDECWEHAPAIGELTMVEPWLGRAPTQRTVVKLLHDRHQLYVALWCFDDDPTRIRASQRARDARLDPDDRVEILLDPFENRRTAYFFQIGAGGSIGDILISGNGGKFDKPWDCVWHGHSRVTEDGWLAEIAIPFRSIPRRDGARTWGFNLTRHVRATSEEYRWANPSQATSFFRVSECGTIEGFGDIDGGVGLELVPYVAAGAGRDRRVDDDLDADVDAGGELYYRLTPSITLATTVFTDFAETEDDGRQINLNRFPLFFPEKRDFFLEGGSYFTFGSAEAGGRRFQPFFTRRIGLAGDGTKIPLVFGSKVTGEAGPFEIGVIDVETDATATTERENLAVARAKYALGDRTTVGLIGTHGDPTSAGTNSVVGADFWHRAPEFVGDLDLVTTVDVVASTGGAGADDGESIGLDVQARGSEWRFGLGGRQVAADFRPALGFVSRRDTRRASATIAWQPRTPEGSSIRRHLVEGRIERGDAIDGEAQEAGFALERLGVELHGGDTIAAFASRTFERVDADFLLFRDSTLVARGDYWTNRAGVLVETSEGRPWNGRLEASTGDFFDGRSDQLEVAGEWRTSPLLHLGLDYESALVDLGPGRAFTTQVGSMRLDLHLDSDLSLRNLVQFDNESNVLGWQSRLRWNYRPGSDFFAVLGTAWEREADGSLVPTGQALEFKVVHTLRF